MKDILNSYSVSELKKEISKTNIKGYSKMKKSEVIELMMKHKERFSYLKMKEMKPKKSPVKKETVKKSEPKKKIKIKGKFMTLKEINENPKITPPPKELLEGLEKPKKKIKLVKKKKEQPQRKNKKREGVKVEEKEDKSINKEAQKLQKEAFELLEKNKSILEKMKRPDGKNNYTILKNKLIQKDITNANYRAVESVMFHFNLLKRRIKESKEEQAKEQAKQLEPKKEEPKKKEFEYDDSTKKYIKLIEGLKRTTTLKDLENLPKKMYSREEVREQQIDYLRYKLLELAKKPNKKNQMTIDFTIRPNLSDLRRDIRDGKITSKKDLEYIGQQINKLYNKKIYLTDLEINTRKLKEDLFGKKQEKKSEPKQEPKKKVEKIDDKEKNDLLLYVEKNMNLDKKFNELPKIIQVLIDFYYDNTGGEVEKTLFPSHPYFREGTNMNFPANYDDKPDGLSKRDHRNKIKTIIIKAINNGKIDIDDIEENSSLNLNEIKKILEDKKILSKKTPKTKENQDEIRKKAIKDFNLKEGQLRRLGKDRGGGIIRIIKLTDKTIHMKTDGKNNTIYIPYKTLFNDPDGSFSKEIIKEPKKEEPKKEEKKKVDIKTKQQLVDNLKDANIEDLKLVQNEGSYEGLIKRIKSDNKKFTTFHIQSTLRTFDNDFVKDIYTKYSPDEIKKYFTRLVHQVNPNKKVFFPKDQRELEGKGFQKRTLDILYKKLPHAIEDGKVYKTFQEFNSRFDKPKEKPKERKETKSEFMKRMKEQIEEGLTHGGVFKLEI